MGKLVELLDGLECREGISFAVGNSAVESAIVEDFQSAVLSLDVELWQAYIVSKERSFYTLLMGDGIKLLNWRKILGTPNVVVIGKRLAITDNHGVVRYKLDKTLWRLCVTGVFGLSVDEYSWETVLSLAKDKYDKIVDKIEKTPTLFAEYIAPWAQGEEQFLTCAQIYLNSPQVMNLMFKGDDYRRAEFLAMVECIDPSAVEEDEFLQRVKSKAFSLWEGPGTVPRVMYLQVKETETFAKVEEIIQAGPFNFPPIHRFSLLDFLEANKS